MAKSDRSGSIQYGVLPYRIGHSEGAEVMLLTSRGTGRWVIPKGWPMIGQKPRTVAKTEAREEAGIEGIISRKPIGTYPYTKIMDDGEARLCECVVYLMLVTHESADWPEQAERVRSWFPRDEAAALVEEGVLALMIQGLLEAPKRIRRRLDLG
jgi:8-oxo-dGTP pyrophosphatase MutT (NUDIX family)